MMMVMMVMVMVMVMVTLMACHACMDYTKGILDLNKNKWCNFSHKSECAINSIYMPV
jgi:hypothetical protein